jgi:hypothetical protein
MAGELNLTSVAPQRGWEALKAIGWSIQKPRPADAERARLQEVFAQIPPARHKMAAVLLRAPGHITPAEIITACNVPATGEASITHQGKQALFEQGMTMAAKILGKPAPATIPCNYPAASGGFHIDTALYRRAKPRRKR